MSASDTKTLIYLAAQVRKGLFREDLFYRVKVIQIDLPPLRERIEDIPLLIQHFLSKFNRQQSKDIADVSEAVMSVLMSYDYPGNIRELENILEHSTVLCHGGTIELHHLPPNLNEGDFSAASIPKQVSLKDLEKIHIINAIGKHDGNRTAAAKALGIHPSTLFRKIKSLGIEMSDRDGRNRKP